jgi:hypothetical protein
MDRTPGHLPGGDENEIPQRDRQRSQHGSRSLTEIPLFHDEADRVGIPTRILTPIDLFPTTAVIRDAIRRIEPLHPFSNLPTGHD